MKRRFLIIILTVLVVTTGIIISSGEPAASAGQLIVTLGKEKYDLEGERYEQCFGGNVKKINLEKSVKQRYDSIYTFNVPIHCSINGEVSFLEKMSVTANGSRTGDVLYTVYSYDGSIMLKQSPKLTLPKDDIDGCIVEIQVKWGNSNNYTGYKYYFAAIYKKDKQ